MAVDPSADMLEQLRRTLPDVTAIEGSAEDTGLEPESFDLVTVAQAWHWCDPGLASTEIARILRPHGVLGLIWNQLDTSVPWVHRLSRIMHAGDVHKPHFRPAVGPEFTGLESHLTRWEDSVTTEDIQELTKSRSYYLAASDSTRAKVIGQPRLVPARAPGAHPRRRAPAALPDPDVAGLPGLMHAHARIPPDCTQRPPGLLFRYA